MVSENQTETRGLAPVINPPGRKEKKNSFKGFKKIKAHLGLNLGSALLPEISFAAVPNHPQPVLTHSRVAKAVFSATWAGQTILCGSELRGDDIPKLEEDSEQSFDVGYEKIPFDKTTADVNPKHFKTVAEVIRDDNDDSTIVKSVEASSNLVEHLYAIPNKKPVKVTRSNAETFPKLRNQIQSLETLKLMKSKKSESSVEINQSREEVTKTWQSESNVTLGSIRGEKGTQEAKGCGQRVQFMDELREKLEILRKEVLETVQENKAYQKQKLNWAQKLKEANDILEENMILKDDIRHLEGSLEESRYEVGQLKGELLNERLVTRKASERISEENSALKLKCAQLQREIKESVPRHQHDLIINEIKMLLENLKLKYQEETDHLYSQLGNNRGEWSDARKELLLYKEQSAQLKSDNASLNAGLQETLAKCQILLTQLKASHQWGETAQDLLATLISVAEHTAQERDQMAEKARAQTQIQQKFVSVLLKRTVSLGRLQESLKGFKSRTIEKVQKMEQLVEETSSESAETQNNLEREIEELKLALQDRDLKLKMLISSKKKMEKDLESMLDKESTSENN